MPRTLSSRGFELPATPPKVGNPSWDTGRWNGPALRKAIIDFLAPDAIYKPASPQPTPRIMAIIDDDAVANGFPRGMFYMLGARRFRLGAALYIGVPQEAIWPEAPPRAPAITSAARPPAIITPWRSLSGPAVPLLPDTPHFNVRPAETSSLWHRWKAATRDLLRWWWSFFA